MKVQSDFIRLRGKLVEEDENGNWNLNDIWELSKAPKTKMPKHWKTQAASKSLISELQKKVTLAYLKIDKTNIPVIYAKRGRGNEGTFAHPILAAAYAGYLSPKLEIETREIWLRYRSGDPKLADEILQKATPEDNEWAAIRALGRSKRNEFTKSLQGHGVTKWGYASCTDAVYSEILNGTAKKIKESRGLNATDNLRNAMTTDELVSVMFAETLARQRIEHESPYGNRHCETATKRSSVFVRQAIEAEKGDRKKTRAITDA